MFVFVVIAVVVAAICTLSDISEAIRFYAKRLPCSSCLKQVFIRTKAPYSTSLRSKVNLEANEREDSVVFAGVKFRHPISTSLRNLNISVPSPIQKASLLPLVTGLSCIIHAETGSGKTLCYLLPILKRLYDSGSSGRLRVLIIVPTKELAVQVT